MNSLVVFPALLSIVDQYRIRVSVLAIVRSQIHEPFDSILADLFHFIHCQVGVRWSRIQQLLRPVVPALLRSVDRCQYRIRASVLDVDRSQVSLI